jgi:excisionase family DNA binding protein
MDGILEQILSELKEIKQLLADNNGLQGRTVKSEITNDTLKTKEAAKYLGIAEHRLRVLTKQGKIKHFTAGNKYLFKRISLDQWLDEVQESSINKSIETDDYGKIRRIKE